MEAIIRGAPDEIAALVLAVQGRQDAEIEIKSSIDTILQSVREAIRGMPSLEADDAPKGIKRPKGQSKWTI